MSRASRDGCFDGLLFVGTSGWSYDGWRNTFYPKGLKQSRELEYLSARVSSIEINGSFTHCSGEKLVRACFHPVWSSAWDCLRFASK